MGLELFTVLNGVFNVIISLVLGFVAVSMAPKDFKTGMLALLMLLFGLILPLGLPFAIFKFASAWHGIWMEP
jgi:hypothetical protein